MTDVETETTEETKEEEPRLPCLCGCGEFPTRKRSRFLPGHDAQLKAALYRTIRDEESSDQDKAEAAAKLDDFNWPQPAPKRKRTKPATEENGDGGEVDNGDGPPVTGLEDLLPQG
jgi:hypothetical protein